MLQSPLPQRHKAPSSSTCGASPPSSPSAPSQPADWLENTNGIKCAERRRGGEEKSLKAPSSATDQDSQPAGGENGTGGARGERKERREKVRIVSKVKHWHNRLCVSGVPLGVAVYIESATAWCSTPRRSFDIINTAACLQLITQFDS